VDNFIIEKMRLFASGADTTLKLANEIEVGLDDAYPDDEFIHETVEMLAMYRPEGGDYLFTAEPIAARLTETIGYLRRVNG
jgi:hypothetical protein